MDSFSKKVLEVTIQLRRGSFGGEGNTKTLRGLACEVSVDKSGLPSKNEATVRLWGMKYEDMRQLTALNFRPLENAYNSITVRAGNEGAELATVFRGDITNAFASFDGSPDVPMQFEALTGFYGQQLAASPTSARGEVKVTELIGNIAQSIGMAFQDEGFQGSVRNAFLPGPPLAQAVYLARQVGAQLIVDDDTLVLLPDGSTGRKVPAVLLTRETGLIGYPSFNQDGVVCRCLYDPNLVYGGFIQLESIVPGAGGLWCINRLRHHLAAEQPTGGPWESYIEAYRYE